MTDTRTPLDTERIDPRYRDIDAQPTVDALATMLDGQVAAVAAVRPALPALAAAVDAAANCIGSTGRLVYAGAGTSGRIAVQDGAELPPTFNWPRDRLVFAVAGGMEALTRSIEGAEDDIAAAERAIGDAGVGPNDIVIGVAASGTTPYTIAAVTKARALGALTVAITSNPGAPLLAAAEHAILIATGAEVIAGSTRMKAGTAQKIVLNLFSTMLMVRLGHVYRGLMVDMQAKNEKLRHRARRMLAHLTGAGEAEIETALDAAGGRVKPAVLMLLRGCDYAEAQQRLAQSDGYLRVALESQGA